MTYDPLDTGPDDNEADREVTIDSVDIADASFLFMQYPVWELQSTSGGGSVTLPGSSAGVHDIRLREPGDAGAQSTTRVWDATTEFDPSVVDEIIVRLSNITIDNSSTARIIVEATDDPSGGPGTSGDDKLTAQIRGNGDVFAVTSENGASNVVSDSSQTNAYVLGLESISIAWDGSTLTVTTDDGSTTVTVSSSSDYPSGENLFLKIAASDRTGSGAENVDFDVDAIEVNP